jgi:DNA-binding XRE family transcriptional regulator
MTLGQHLRKKRFTAGLRQTEAAQHLGINTKTLSNWETDRLYPSWAFHPRIIAYLGMTHTPKRASKTPKDAHASIGQ